MTYQEKLLDPRWQRQRLIVLEKAGWACQCCGSTVRTLHVHHLIYAGRDPWETPVEHLECLCQDCHEWREDFNALFGRGPAPTLACALFVKLWKCAFDGSWIEEPKSPFLQPAVDEIKRQMRSANPFTQ